MKVVVVYWYKRDFIPGFVHGETVDITPEQLFELHEKYGASVGLCSWWRREDLSKKYIESELKEGAEKISMLMIDNPGCRFSQR